MYVCALSGQPVVDREADRGKCGRGGGRGARQRQVKSRLAGCRDITGRDRAGTNGLRAFLGDKRASPKCRSTASRVWFSLDVRISSGRCYPELAATWSRLFSPRYRYYYRPWTDCDFYPTSSWYAADFYNFCTIRFFDPVMFSLIFIDIDDTFQIDSDESCDNDCR